MNRLLSVAVLAGAGYVAWRYFRARARSAAPRAPAPPSDELLTRRVLVSLRHAGVMPEALHMRVLAGTVILSGSVSAVDRDRVLRAILNVPGIRGVRNDLALRDAPPERDVESRPWEGSPRAG